MIVMVSEYDQAIQGAVRGHLPDWYDWRLYKAQIYKESTFNPLAVSGAGAEGLLQFMPGTWAEVKHALALPDHATPYMPEYAIPAGAYYMQKMRERWKWERPEADRTALALASYNAGFGNLVKAQKLAGGAIEYAPIAAQLHNITGEDNATETRTYVKKILKLYAGLLTGDIGHG